MRNSRGMRMVVLTAVVCAAALLHTHQAVAVQQVSVGVTIQPSLCATRLGDSLVVRSNVPWVLTIDCADDGCPRDHVQAGQATHGDPVVVELHGDGYSLCMR